MSLFRPSRVPAYALSLGMIGTATLVAVAPPAVAAGRIIDVQPGDGTLQAAVNNAAPGDVLSLAGGIYTGQVTIRTSGTASDPITIQPAGPEAVTVAASFSPVPCDNSGPISQRTFKILDGADYWTISGLNIVNGVWAAAKNGPTAQSYFNALAKAGDWQTRRSLPGRGLLASGDYGPDRIAARDIYSELSIRTGVPIDPVEGLRIVGNDISGRGVHVVAGRDGELARNTIHDIDCGIGPGVWINTYSDFWQVHDNIVRDVAASTRSHFMQEGIRFGSASSYNVVSDNTVSDLPGDGRGINTDIDASWNTIQHNTVSRTAIGFNDQQSGWGNRWVDNTADTVRTAGFGFRNADGNLTAPSYDLSTNMAFVQCNRVQNSSLAMTSGTMMHSTFTDNYFTPIDLSQNLQSYWTSAGNTWNDSSETPAVNPPQPPRGACGSPASTVPGRPTAVAATAGDAAATVSWTPPADDGGSPISGYTVTSSPGGISATVGGSVTSATVPGLVNGTSYTFTVTATNAVGPGQESDPSAAVTPQGVPGRPTAVTATAGDAAATVTWTPPADDGGSPIIRYTVTSSSGAVAQTADGSTISATVTGLANGTSYTFTVTATNAVGPGPASASSNTVTPKSPTTGGTQSASVTDSGYYPKSLYLKAQGYTVAWSFAATNSRSHTVTDSSGMGLFNSGLKARGSTYSFLFRAAGTYNYRSVATGDPTTMTGSVNVPLSISPLTGGTGTTYTVTWASAAPGTGFFSDVQYQYKPCAKTATCAWQAWRSWKSNQTTTLSASFSPPSGAGTYQFRAHLGKQVSATTKTYSGWSPWKVISVT